MHARLTWLPFLSVLLALASALCAQDATLTLTAAFEPATAKPGDAVTLVLKASVTPGWHAYGTLEQTNIPVALAADKLQLGGLTRAGDAAIMQLLGEHGHAQAGRLELLQRTTDRDQRMALVKDVVDHQDMAFFQFAVRLALPDQAPALAGEVLPGVLHGRRPVRP